MYGLTGGISKQTYVYFSFLSSVVDVQDPLKLTLIMVKRRTSYILTLSGGVGLGAMYGLPECFLQTTHQRRSVFMYCLADGIP